MVVASHDARDDRPLWERASIELLGAVEGPPPDGGPEAGGGTPVRLDTSRGPIDCLLHRAPAGGETAVLVDQAGNVTEGPGFNVFMVRGGRVSTPARGILEGITRLTVIELCAEAGIPLEETLVHADALRGADEVFLSSTAGGILPVTTVDGKPLGDGAPGPLTMRLRELYWSKKEAGWHGTLVEYH